MASYQRVALFIFFDAIERDLAAKVAAACSYDCPNILSDEERVKARARLQRRDEDMNRAADIDLLMGLDLGEKYSVLMRHKERLDQSAKTYFTKKLPMFEKAIPVRNATMHGRPLTIEQYAFGFSLAQDFLNSPSYWPSLNATYRKYGNDPEALLSLTVKLLDEDISGEILHNLPVPDYDDTGFLPRSKLEQDLIRKIKGRHPVVTVLGDGGNGKTALTLQTLYGLLQSNDHDFDAFVWVSAKTNRLTVSEVKRIEGAITSSLGIFEEVSEQFQAGEGDPISRVRNLLEQNKVLLIIDNLETVLDDALIEFAAEVPGQSKILFTSRVPLGSDLSVNVPEFSEAEALAYLRRLIEAYDVSTLRKEGDDVLKRHLSRLAHKPLLIKWFALGVATGLEPAKITANPSIALAFCMENVFERLTSTSKNVLAVMAVIPQPLSVMILQHIGQIEPAEVEAAIAEINKFGIIERVKGSEFERLYRVKPFARSYVTRVLKIIPRDSEAILGRYRGVASAYQSERGGEFRNKYDLNVFTVRSPTEAVAVRRLRHAIGLAFKRRFDEASKVINELKITNPDYFEVYRISAFISYRQGDILGANQEYEAAFDLANGQPQLHYFYGGFLLRSYGDFMAARDEFLKALAIDPNSNSVLREAARANFFLYDFDAAQILIDRAWGTDLTTFKDEVIVHDLQAQLFIRKADYLNSSGDPKGAYRALANLHEFLAKIEPELIDDTFASHLVKVYPTIEAARNFSVAIDKNLLESLLKTCRSLVEGSAFVSYKGEGSVDDGVLYDRSGHLKESGRTDRYGFLRDTFDVDTYVARSGLATSLWRDMCDGKTVRYDIWSSHDGRTWADKVELV
ncbi:NB-ARC domain-containing protein [Novosphingobium sp. PhB55]|uniref:NB-ARC domain-containing protein n=1 Tax=Novosphingobium sp. PhB55 TaxID=2485106 RepID=UPI0010DF3B3D|nr:NB-ARC domain-containing protein [Novosphingobium sp. PhB55]TDW63106.1 NB-ARC domain-containing protein [Novosphingobium sp. PhB55]